MRVSRTGPILPLKINTMPHPGFPTDMQPLMGVLLSVADGTSTVTEGVWDNRFRYVDELRKMGANVQVDGQVAVFEGVDHLSPAPLRASDLRAGAAMVVAALIANGTSEMRNRPHRTRLREYRAKAPGAGCRYPQDRASACLAGTGTVNKQKRTQSVLGRAVSFPVHGDRGGPTASMAEFISLYSGSSGNSSVVRCGERYLIVDMGKGVRSTTAALKALDSAGKRL